MNNSRFLANHPLIEILQDIAAITTIGWWADNYGLAIELLDDDRRIELEYVIFDGRGKRDDLWRRGLALACLL
jgi:hypothetical protein